MQKLLFFLSILCFSTCAYTATSPLIAYHFIQTPPDSLLGTWDIDSIKMSKMVLTRKQVGNLGGMRILANNMLIMHTKDKENLFHTFTYDGKKIFLVEDKTSLAISKISQQYMTIYSKNEGQEVWTVYKKR